MKVPNELIYDINNFNIHLEVYKLQSSAYGIEI